MKKEWCCTHAAWAHGFNIPERNDSRIWDDKHRPNRKVSMMTSSNGNIFRVTGPSCGEFTGLGEFPTQRPVTRSFDVFSDLRLNKRLSKQPWGWWFETLSCPLWRHCNVGIISDRRLFEALCYLGWIIRLPHCQWRNSGLLFTKLTDV